MKENLSQQEKTPRRKRMISAEEKVRAVLSIWTECQTISSLCRELSVTRNQLVRWQEIAMAAMKQALDQTSRKKKKSNLNQRLESLILNNQPPKKKQKTDEQQHKET